MLYYISRLIKGLKLKKRKAPSVNILNDGKWNTEDGLAVHYVIVKPNKPVHSIYHGDHY